MEQDRVRNKKKKKEKEEFYFWNYFFYTWREGYILKYSDGRYFRQY